ncbi:MAG: multidrug efflux RND transporter permease subunit [Planctomycetes bacterium]|nr:multidrug efflux RND transporter permease subunit [Planctomycetota bacterium]
MFSRFFIDRPIFASVLSIVITLAGAIAAFQLPLAQYPPVTPPTVQFDCNYPGASAQVVAQTVAAPIEQQVNGVENMLYMSSQCTSDGSYTLTVTFETGVDLDLAQVLVQNRLALAMPQLPAVVRQAGVSTRKRSPELLMTVSMSSPSIDGKPPRYDQLYLSNYALTKLRDEISRLPGISEIILFGQRDYSMRIWLDPDKLAVRGLAVTDVIAAVREQNLAISPGQMGQPPSISGQPLQIPLSLLGRLREPEEFADIIVRATSDGRKIRIRDLGHVEMSAKSQDVSNRFDGKPTVGLAVFMLADANALNTADAVKAKMEELSADFPEGMVYEIGYDTTPFIRESILEVFKSLLDAIVLVALVVLIFLQGWRAAIIPLIAVPVAISGTFAVMAVAGFSINNLTLFGLVLAIGIVVDDAIVVVESVEHHIENGLPPRAAAFKAMDEVSGPVIAVGLVLSAVFIPCAFLSGIVGQFFRQFALTIAVSTVISTFNSLTLSPALAALLLKPRNAKRDWLTRSLDFLLGWLFSAFNLSFRWSTRMYTRFVGALLRVPAIVLVLYAGLVGLTWWGFGQLPTGFIPIQDKGYLVASIQLPDSSSALRTRDVMSKIERIANETPGVKNVNAVAGNSFMLSAYGSNFGSMFIILDNFDQRRAPELYADEIIGKLKKRYASEVPEAIVNVFPPPAVSGLGRSGGFKLMVQDRGDVGLNELQQHTDNLVDQGNAQKNRVSGLFTVFNANSPQLFADVDREKCLKEGVSLADVFSTLQAYLGSLYVNDFNKFGRTWQVVVQADQTYRNEVGDVKKLRVRNSHGQMVPLGTLVDVRMIGGPLVLTRYNMYPAAAIQGNAVSGVSTGQAIRTMEEIARREFPSSVGFEWTEIAYLETRAADTALLVFGLSVAGVFLVLAALYESWSLPLAVILVVPMCVLSSLAGVWLAKMDINIFTQIGFVVLIGLASKNAILIVEFAKARREEGQECRTATLQACELRLRPIMMTSFAFILGVVPLVRAHGAGAEMRRTLGTAVFSGMLGVTLFGILLTPVFFFVIDRLAGRRLFSGGPFHRLGVIALDFLSLRSVRRWSKAAWTRRSSGARMGGQVPSESIVPQAGSRLNCASHADALSVDTLANRGGGPVDSPLVVSPVGENPLPRATPDG